MDRRDFLRATAAACVAGPAVLGGEAVPSFGLGPAREFAWRVDRIRDAIRSAPGSIEWKAMAVSYILSMRDESFCIVSTEDNGIYEFDRNLNLIRYQQEVMHTA